MVTEKKSKTEEVNLCDERNILCSIISYPSLCPAELCKAQKNQLSLALCYVGDNVSHKSPSWNAVLLTCQEANISRHIL